MADNTEIEKKAREVGKVAAEFLGFADGALSDLIENAPADQKEAIKKQVDGIRSGDFKVANSKLDELNKELDNIKL